MESLPPPDSHELSKVMGLLREYAEKLRLLCEDRIKFKHRQVLIIVLGTLSGVMTILTVTLIMNSTRGESDAKDAIPLMALLAGLVVIPPIFVLIRDRTKPYAVHQVAATVERMIRMASQYGEHAMQSVGDRFEFDIRLAEAEASLRLYEEVFREPKRQLN